VPLEIHYRLASRRRFQVPIASLPL
jgi:hypothetical protein